MSSLNDAAKIAMTEVLGLREGEEVLVLTNPGRDAFSVARALYEEARALGGRPVIVVQETKVTTAYAERLVLEAIKAEPDVLLSITTARVGKDPCGLIVGHVGRDGRRFDHVLDKVTKGDRRVRGFSSPKVSPAMFARCVPVDYSVMRDRAAQIKRAMDGGKEIHVTSPGGTDVRFSIEGRKTFANTGDYRLPGKYGNLPAGEVYVSPANGSSSGTIAFDGTMSTLNGPTIPLSPVKVTFTDGFISTIAGGPEAGLLRKTLEEGEALARRLGDGERERNCRHIGEFGIGINDRAMITGVILEDEKALKTCHFAIGSNYDFDAPAIIHRDGVVMRPSVWVDGRMIMEDGDVLV